MPFRKFQAGQIVRIVRGKYAGQSGPVKGWERSKYLVKIDGREQWFQSCQLTISNQK